MRGLFFKIFAIFWIAQSLIFVITTELILRHHRPSPQIFFDTLNRALRNEAQESADAYEKGGCTALAAYAAAQQQTLSLADSGGHTLCGPQFPAPWVAHEDPSHAGQVMGAQFGDQYVWRLSISARAGTRYVLLVSRRYEPEHHPWYQDLAHFAFPQLLVAIVVGGVMTWALVLLLTRPLVRLRRAARELAQGNLKARVEAPERQSRLLEEDEFRALVHDFNHMAERLELLVDAQQMLLRDVSHELRSPLARLSVALELAREDAAPGEAIHLDRIERETQKLNQLIGQLLSLASMEAIERTDNFEPLSLKKLIEEMIPDAEYEAQQRQCSVQFSAEGECMVAGNRPLLYRAIENVVRNAVRYTEAGSAVEIRLSCGGTSGRALLAISDRGPGIPEAELSEIFRPFYRVDRARSTETGGFGVGLAIAERAVKLHHGELQAANRRGGGTEIRMSLPLLSGAATAAGAKADSAGS